MKSKWGLIGLILSAVGAIAGLAGGIVADKQMEEEIDAAVERRLNPPKEEEEDS